MEDLFSKFSADQLTDTNYCDVVCVQLTTQMTHCLQTLFYDVQYYFACIMANMEAFRWKFIDIFEDVCSLHTRFSADLFHLLCCIRHAKIRDVFFGPPGIMASRFKNLEEKRTDRRTDRQTDTTDLVRSWPTRSETTQRLRHINTHTQCHQHS